MTSTNDRLLDCGLCYEENGEEVHPHPECPVGGVGPESVGESAPVPPTPRCPNCQHPMGDHSVHKAPRPTWCHACNTECGHQPTP